MAWPIFALCLSAQVELSAQRTPPSQHEDDAPAVVLEDVEVSARRGSARISAEREFDGAAIDNLAAYDIAEVVRRVSERIGDHEPPVILINGRKVADPTIFTGFPPDAMVRLEVLPPQAAAMYGEASNRRVMNLVLEQHFRSATLQTGGSRPVSGGTSSIQTDLRRSVLADQSASFIGAQATISTALRAGERSGYTLGQPGGDLTTLRPQTQLFSANLGFNRPLGEWSSSLRMDVRSMESRATTNAADQLVAYRNRSDAFTVQAGLNGDLAGWTTQTSVNLGLARSEQSGLSDSRQRVESVGVDAQGSRRLLSLPVGEVLANLSTNFSASRTAAEGAAIDGQNGATVGTFSSAAFRGGVTLPLFGGGEPSGTRRSRYGDATLSLGGNLATGHAGSGQGLNADLSWNPAEKLLLNAAITTGTAAPSAQKLYAPLVYGQPTTVFDFITGEAVQVVPISGGNPNLRAPRSDQILASLNAGPFTSRVLMIGFTYMRSDTKDGIGQLTVPSTVLEAAYPDRFIRNEAGRLIAVDRRPLNMASSLSDTVSATLSAALPVSLGKEERQVVTVNLNSSYHLRDITRLGLGEPVLDRLAGIGGGQPRRDATVHVETNRGRWHASASARWQSGYRLRRAEAAGPDDLIIDDLALINLRLAFKMMRSSPRPEGGRGDSRAVAGGQLVIEIENLLDARPEATLGDGRPAPGYGRDDQDPIGRLVRIQLSRRF